MRWKSYRVESNLFRDKNGKNYHMQTNKQTEWSYVIYNPNNDRYLPILVENILNLHKRSRILLQNLKVKKKYCMKSWVTGMHFHYVLITEAFHFYLFIYFLFVSIKQESSSSNRNTDSSTGFAVLGVYQASKWQRFHSLWRIYIRCGHSCLTSSMYFSKNELWY